MPAETTGLRSITTRMSGGAAWAIGALAIAVVAQRTCGVPVFRDVGATVGVLLLVSCAAVAVPSRSRADSLWTLGALSALPLAWLFAAFATDPALRTDLSDFGRFVAATEALAPVLLECCVALFGAAVTVRVVGAWAPALILLLSGAALVLNLSLGVLAIVTPQPPRIEQWRAFEAQLPRTNAMRHPHTGAGDDTERFAPVDPGPLFERAYAVRLPVSRNHDDAERVWSGPEGILATVRGQVVQIEGCMTRLPDDGMAVLFLSRNGGLLWSPAWGPGRGVPCSLDSRADDLRRLPASRGGFATPLGSPQEAGWLVLVAAALGALGLYEASRLRARGRWIDSLEEATLVLHDDVANARLSSGELLQLCGSAPDLAARIFVARTPPAAEAGYRGDPRRRLESWLATREPRETIVASLRARAAEVEALSLFAMLWLCAPGACAVLTSQPLSVW